MFKVYNTKKLVFLILVFTTIVLAVRYIFNQDENSFQEQTLKIHSVETTTKNLLLKKTAEEISSDNKMVKNNHLSNDSVIPANIFIENVPFIVQAPKADWKDERQQDGCEEASVVMTVAWLNGEKEINKNEALKRIFEASDWFLNNVGTFHDASVVDVVRILKELYQIKTVEVKNNPDLFQLKELLSQNKLILVPTNGQLLGNPNFSGSGPERHMIVLRGYDDQTGEFITNDPGTRKGENYRYPYATVLKANLSYPTGYHEKLDQLEKAVIVVGK